MDSQFPDSAPTALADLIAAGLVSHEMIGDPAALGSEAEALQTLCAQVLGPVWRLDPFHYAFRARPEDLGGQLAAIAPEGWTAALEAALRVELGANAVWISAADQPPAASLPDLPLLLLRAQGSALAEGLAVAGPGTQAVIQARFAVEAARLAAGAEPGSALAHRLAVIETRQEEILEMLVERAAGAAARAATEAATLGRLAATLAATAQRLDAQVAAFARAAESERHLDADAGTAAFRADLALTLAEFLARLEQAAEGRGAPLPAPALPRLG